MTTDLKDSLVQERYGISLAHIKSIHTLDTDVRVSDTDGVVYKVVKDRYQEGAVLPVLTFDHYHSPLYDDLKVGQLIDNNLRVTDKGLPLCSLNLAAPNFCIDAWVDSAKVKKSCILGARFKELDAFHEVFKINSEYSFHRLVQRHEYYLKAKGDQYDLPPNYLLNMEYATYKLFESAKDPIIYFFSYFAMRDSDDVYNGYGFLTKSGVAYVPFMWVTREEQLAKRHSPASTFHIRISKWIHEYFKSDVHKIDFGSYFQYKEAFNFDLSYSKGLEFCESVTDTSP